MKPTVAVLAAVAALVVPIQLAAQGRLQQQANQTRYTVQNLGSLGGTGCCFVITINNVGWVDGTSNVAGDKSFHPFLWRDGKMQDLGTLGGPNASAGGMNDVGDVTVGGSDTTTPDPLGEDWCGFGTHLICRSYIWHNGKRTMVPTLGGNNGDVSTITDAGLVLGFAETAEHDATCVAPQVLGTEGFLWNPEGGEIRVLPPLAGDTVTAAFGLNRYGDAAGTSGICGGGLSATSALHAVVWKNGMPINLGSFGGSYGHLASAINNQFQVVGQSDLPGDTVFHGFLWTENKGMQDLGTLLGDISSVANDINDGTQIAMQSCDANSNCRAAIWQNGVMTDLNALIPAASPLFLVSAASINSRGQIAGAALDQSTGAMVPFLATPCGSGQTDKQGCEDVAGSPSSAVATTVKRPDVIIPWNIRAQLRQRNGMGRPETGIMNQQ